MFRHKREEWLPAMIMTLVFTCLQAVFISRYFDSVAHRMHGNGSDFIQSVPWSGYDAYSYAMMTDYMVAYEPFRHPLVFPLFFPLYLLNKLLMMLTGINCSQFIWAAVMLPVVFYSYVFMYRILRELVGTDRLCANLLSVMLFGYGHVMLSMVSPDLFGVSMLLLLIAIYVVGREMTKQAWWLFLPIAGLTLSNGLKIFVYSLFLRGRGFFSWKYLSLAVMLPSLVLLGVAWMQESIRTEWNDGVFRRADQQVREELLSQIRDTASINDEAYIQAIYKKEIKRRIMERYRRNHAYDKAPRIKGESMGKGQFASWTDVSTERLPTIVENVFGESLQLHEDYLLCDIFRGRPVIVEYRHAYNYMVEAVVAVLFLAGIWRGRRSRFLWMCLSGVAVDVFIHLILGFGIDEVYIMTTHWAFILPIAMGYLTVHSS